MTIEKIICFIGSLIKEKFTGQIIINFSNGNLSKKVDKVYKETIDLI